MRIKSRGDFARVRKNGRSFGGRFLVLGVLADPELEVPFKFGFILTRKVGNAVARNRVRRRLRAILSEFGDSLEPTGYVVTIARHRAPEASFEDLRRDWKKLARKAGILSDSEPV
jgi:ribonuclease P protein component